MYLVLIHDFLIDFQNQVEGVNILTLGNQLMNSLLKTSRDRVHNTMNIIHDNGLGHALHLLTRKIE